MLHHILVVSLEMLRIQLQKNSYRISLKFPVLEYENALIEFDGDINEAILQRIVSNPIHVYKLVRDMESFGSKVLSKPTDDSDVKGNFQEECV